MKINDDVILDRLRFYKQKKERLEKEYDQSNYIACIDSGRLFDEEAHNRIGYQLDAVKDQYIESLENIFIGWCHEHDLDLALFFDMDCEVEE